MTYHNPLSGTGGGVLMSASRSKLSNGISRRRHGGGGVYQTINNGIVKWRRMSVAASLSGS